MTTTDVTTHRLSYEGSNRELADHLRDGHHLQVPEEGRNALDSGWWSDLDARHAAAHDERTPVRDTTYARITEDDTVVLLAVGLALTATELATEEADSGDALEAILDAVRSAYRHGSLEQVEVREDTDQGAVISVTVETTP